MGTIFDAAGSQTAVAVSGHGADWRLHSLARPPGTASTLSGISCPAVRNCTAVGYRSDSDGQQLPLAEIRGLGGWHLQPIPTPPHAVATNLSAVSCTGLGCVAVGNRVTGAGADLQPRRAACSRIMEIMATPNSAGAIGNVLTSVSCASTCAAAGYAYTPGPNGFPLPPVPTALVERSGQWVLRNVGIPPGTGGTALYGVSWDGRRATAAGYQFATSGLQVTFAATGR